MRDLPPPVDGAQDYLAAVHERIGETNALLTQLLARFPAAEEPPADGTVELREPAQKPAAAPRRRQTKTTRKEA